ncbi:hypothetical protein BJX65DRAFT_261595 [Aspergillus insuetus]
MPVRAACDRCHRQKLRCIKPDGADFCDRCTTAATECRFTESMRGVRPTAKRRLTTRDRSAEAAFQVSNSETDRLSAMGVPGATLQENLDPSLLLWGSPAFPDPVFAPELLNLPNNHNTFLDETYGLTIPNNTDARETESTVLALDHKLHQLSQQLCDLAAKIPPLPIWQNYRSTCPSNGLEFHIDEAFTMADAIVDVGKQFIQHLRQPQSGSQPDHSLSLASLFIILSCYSRIMDIWTLIFIHTRNCARESSKRLANDIEATVIRVPHVTIGSFTPSMPLAIEIHLTLMARGTAQVEKSIRELMNAISTPERPPEIETSSRVRFGGEGELVTESCSTVCGAPGSVAFMSCSAILERAEAMVSEAKGVAKVVRNVVERQSEAD